jgi:hypothetical protein
MWSPFWFDFQLQRKNIIIHFMQFLFIFFFTIILCALLIFNIQWSKSFPFSLEKKEQISQKLQ